MAALDRPISYLITRGVAINADTASIDDVLASIRLGVEQGVSMVQVREKLLSAGHLFELVRSAARIARGSSTKLLVNDRADIAAAAGADGVHLRSDSMPTAVVRNAFPELIIGRSVHDEDSAASEAMSADLVLFGPVFTTPGKGEPAGLERLKAICDRLRHLPVLAVGGMTAANSAAALINGAAGVAAIREMNEPDSLNAIMTAIKR